MTGPYVGGALDLGALKQKAEAPNDAPAGIAAFFEVTEENFEADLIRRSAEVPVIALIGSPRSPASEQLKADLKSLAEAGNLSFIVGYINADVVPQVAQVFGVQNLPTTVAIAAGQGWLPSAVVREAESVSPPRVVRPSSVRRGRYPPCRMHAIGQAFRTSSVHAGQGDAEAGAAPRDVVGFDGAVVRIDDALGDGESQPGSAGRARAGVIAAIKACEQEFWVDITESGPVVHDAYDRTVGESFEPDDDVPFLADEAAGVRRQVVDDLVETVGIAEHVGGFADHFDRAAPFVDQGFERVGDLVRHAMQIDALERGAVGAVFDVLQCEQVVRKAREALGFAHDGLAEPGAHLGRHIGVEHGFGASMDGRERRAQLMGDVADEFRLAFLLDVQVSELGFRFLEQRREIMGEQVGLIEAPVGDNLGVRLSAQKRLRLAMQVFQGLGDVVADHEADRERDERAGGRHPEHGHGPERVDQHEHACEQGARRREDDRQDGEVCLKALGHARLRLEAVPVAADRLDDVLVYAGGGQLIAQTLDMRVDGLGLGDVKLRWRSCHCHHRCGHVTRCQSRCRRAILFLRCAHVPPRVR